MSLVSIQAGAFTLAGLDKVNILVGKNGCGKSSALRAVDQHGKIETITPSKRYISPERGGPVKFESGIAQNISNNLTWLNDVRRKNRAEQFRQQSTVLFSQLETSVLRQIERDKRSDLTFTFDKYVSEINSLLDNISITRGNTSFSIKSRASSQQIDADQISSGESELISLSIECLSFESESKPNEEFFLLVDEPDVHLHPDLQERLISFLHKIAARSSIRVIISTHSTPILGALSGKSDVSICFMKAGVKNLIFSPISQSLQRLVPVFGAHPLSSVFNKAPPLIVEGTDELRIWQQAFRSSNGRLKFFAVECDGVGNQSDFEQEASRILDAVYDTAVGYSLRDGDNEVEELGDLSNIFRFRLKCHSSENLLLTDEVLQFAGSTWVHLKSGLEKWLADNSGHPRYSSMCRFRDSGPDRRNFSIKEIRLLLLSLLPTNKPWEVLVGQTISGLTLVGNEAKFTNSESIYSFLGEKLCHAIIPRENA